MPLISIIVPVYNTEKYLRRCIDSILAQTFTDFELLLINDGSKDSSGTICDEYALKDCRIRVFHKENGGVSSARNLGLDNASGTWVIFVDSDDALFGNDVFTKIHNRSEDFIVFSYIEEESQLSYYADCGYFENLCYNKFLEKNLGLLQLRTPWAKAYKRSIINGIRFDESLIMCEDTLFNLQYYRRCSNVFSDMSVFYVYKVPISTNKYMLSIKESLRLFGLIKNEYDSLCIESPEFSSSLYNWFLHLISTDKRNIIKWYSCKSVREYYFKHIHCGIKGFIHFYGNFIRSSLIIRN